MIHKNNCTIYTPQKYAETLLDSISYTTENSIFNKKILEFSCGEGAILSEIVRRFVKSCKKNNLSEKALIDLLNENVVAYEIISETAIICEDKINRILKEEFALNKVKFKVIKGDFLLIEDYNFYDYIVGNPPYIDYHALMANPDKYSLDILKKTYESCKKGPFDYSYPFIEKANQLLINKGAMSLLVPNSIFRNNSARIIRNIIKPRVSKIIDYTNKRVFSDALISAAIIVITNDQPNDIVTYYHDELIAKLDKSKLFIDNWFFSNETFDGPNRFGDYFSVSNSCATLLNEAFLIAEENLEKYEKELIRPSGSPRSLKRGKVEYIIFPYISRNNVNSRIDEDKMINDFPAVYNHLSKFKERLIATDKSNGTKWYEYGRSQGLLFNDLPKMLMSPLITHKIHLYEIDKSAVPYSGLIINQITDKPLSLAAKILHSDRFGRYVKKHGVSRSGATFQIGSRLIENYRFSLEEVECVNS